MHWTLFARLEQAVSRARSLVPQRDAEAFAAQMRKHVPELFTELDGDTAQRCALRMAEAALLLLGQLPAQINESAASLVDATPSAPNETLARTAALAYVACANDLLPDDMPVGYGLIDDALLLRAAEAGPAATWDYDSRLQQLGTEARFLSLFLPRALLSGFATTLDDLFRTIATYNRFPLFVLKEATRKLIEDPPCEVAELMPRAEHENASAPVLRPPLFAIVPGRLQPGPGADDPLVFEFADGVRLELDAGELRLQAQG